MEHSKTSPIQKRIGKVMKGIMKSRGGSHSGTFRDFIQLPISREDETAKMYDD